MQPRHRAAVIEAFNIDPQLSVFLISLKVGAVDLDWFGRASFMFTLTPTLPCFPLSFLSFPFFLVEGSIALIFLL